MNVTKANFPSVLPEFGNLLEQCEFYAIDGEMTGIEIPSSRGHVCDEPEVAFEKKCRVAETYSFIQFGICLFQENSGPGPRYVARPFNFFVFPSSDERLCPGRTLVLEPDGISFNKRNQMDFQKWFYEGVGYCNAAQEDRYRARKLEQFTAPAPTSQLTDPIDKKVAAELERKVKEWYADKNGSSEYVLPQKAERRVRLFVQSQLRDLELTFTNRGRLSLVVRGKTSQEAAAEQVESQILDFVGFRKVFNLMVASKKPVIGHHCLSDYLFLIAAMDADLPKKSQDFAILMQRYFPHIYDTRLLASYIPDWESKFRSRGLQMVAEYYMDSTQKKMANVTFPLGFDRYAEALRMKAAGKTLYGALAHEAGYDALCAGYVYLCLREELSLQTLAACQNVFPLFRSLYAINVGARFGGNTISAHVAAAKAEIESPHIPSFLWVPEFDVIEISYPVAWGYSDVEARCVSLKGQLQWVEQGTAMFCLNAQQGPEFALRTLAVHAGDGLHAKLLEKPVSEL